MPQIRNQQDLQTTMEKLAEEALESISKEVLGIFQEKYLKKMAYTDNPVKYQRTNEFYSAWEFSKLKKSVNMLSTELWYNYGKMPTFDPDNFIHGSKYGSKYGSRRPPDVRSNLMDILNKTGYSSSLWISVNRKFAYWSEFIIDMFDNGQLEKIISKHFTSRGFKRV